MRKYAVLLIGLAALSLSRVNAQGLSLGPQFGYQKGQDADNGKLMVGGAMRLKLTSALGVEGSINYREESYGNGAVTVRNWPVMATGLLYPLPILYGAVGAGWYNTTFDYDPAKFPGQTVSNETKQRVGWHFGGGLEVPTGSSSRLTADIRYVFLDYNFTSVPGSSGTNSDFYVVTLGYLFDL